MTSPSPPPPALVGFLVAVYGVGALANGAAPPCLRREYARWGLPDGFHKVTAAVEVVTAGLLIPAGTRVAGAALGTLFIGAVLATLLYHREYAHAVAPAIGFVATAACGWQAARAPVARAAGSGVR